jgi:hypothetical protein
VKSTHAVSCHFAAKSYVNADKLHVHQRSHTIERPFPCGYPGCAAAFHTASLCNAHARLHLDVARPYQCPLRDAEVRTPTRIALKPAQPPHPARTCTLPLAHCIALPRLVAAGPAASSRPTSSRSTGAGTQVCSAALTDAWRPHHHRVATTSCAGERPYACPYDGCGRCFTQVGGAGESQHICAAPTLQIIGSGDTLSSFSHSRLAVDFIQNTPHSRACVI